jgi:hypothetical protein
MAWAMSSYSSGATMCDDEQAAAATSDPSARQAK